MLISASWHAMGEEGDRNYPWDIEIFWDILCQLASLFQIFRLLPYPGVSVDHAHFEEGKISTLADLLENLHL